MGRLYTASFDDVAVTAAQDFFELVPATDKPIEIYGLFLTQSTEVGDTQEEMLRYSIIRGHTTSGSGGSAPTPAALNSNDTAAGATAEVNNTTIAATGTIATLHVGTFNVRTGLELWLPPEGRWGAEAGDNRIVCRLLAAPTDSVSMSGTVYFEELF